MKAACIIGLVALLSTASALPVDDRVNGENGWYVPQANGSFEWIDLDDAKDLLKDVELSFHCLIGKTVSFYLYTHSNPTKGQEITTESSTITSSHFNKDHPTRIVIHGWNQSYKDSINTKITKAWLSRGDYNVIIVNWYCARSLSYIPSAVAVPGAGAKVGNMIKFLNESHDLALDTLHVIGHSLGAHVAGHAGKTVGKGRIHTIIGLDPAGPLFRHNEPNNRLSSDDAYYVESIQTNGGKLGFLEPIGKGAFYPNGGKKQPGCFMNFISGCSHRRSVTYYVEAVTKNNFGTMKCDSYKAAVNKQCGNTYSDIRMGDESNADKAEGIFYVPVNKKSPHGNIN